MIKTIMMLSAFLFVVGINTQAAANAPPAKTEIVKNANQTNQMSQAIAFHAEVSYVAEIPILKGTECATQAISTPAESEVITPHGYTKPQTKSLFINKFTGINPLKMFTYYRCKRNC